MFFPESELVLNNKGQVYHLGLYPENISEKIILVGDQDRVSMVSNFFDEIVFQQQHREFCTHSGIYKGKKITVISTGIGTDNIDIVINEIDALVNIDLKLRKEKDVKTALELIRIGTCGILQPDIPVHSYLLTTYAFGIDNLAHFYPIQFSDYENSIKEKLFNHIKYPSTIQPYVSECSDLLFNKLKSDLVFEGITVTSSGFYGPQGRSLRLGVKTLGVNEKLTSFDFDNHKIINFEMESSALFALGKALGHKCATICLGVANRPQNKFSKGYHQQMKDLIIYVLDRI